MAVIVFALKIPLDALEHTWAELFFLITLGALTYVGVLGLISPSVVLHDSVFIDQFCRAIG